MRCPTCDGRGEVPDPVDHDPERYCDGSVNVDENGESTLGCLIKGPPHDGPHHDVTGTCCASCGGMNSHASWCPDIETTSSSYMDVMFDDDGWYWAVPREVATRD